MNLRHGAGDGDLGDEHIRTRSSIFLAEGGSRLIDMELQQALKPAAALTAGPRSAFLSRVLFEPDFPVRDSRSNPVGQVGKNREISRSLVTRRRPILAAFENGTKTVIHCIRSEAGKTECRAKRAGADIFDGPNTLVGIDDFIANLESHTGSPTNHRCQVFFLCCGTTLESVRLAAILSSRSGVKTRNWRGFS